MKVVHVVPHVGAEASGPSYSVCSLARALARGSHDVTLLSVLDGELERDERFVHRVFPKGNFMPGLWRSPELFRALRDAAPTSDVLHSHSLWMMPNIYPGWIARQPPLPLVISPRGTLSSWALRRSRLKKQLVWALVQGKVVRSAACLHATAEEEYRDIRNLGLRQPVCVIPNGIDVPLAADPEVTAPPAARADHIILYLGRLHSIKGIDRLLRAWTTLARERPDWCLRIVGPDDGGHEAELRALAASLGTPRLTFAGPAYGSRKWDEYRAAALYVLPTHSENFGLTVAEALASGTPAITTKGAPWSGLERESCGFWIDQGVEPLVVALRHATRLGPLKLAEQGARGRAWMLRDFSWDKIAEQMANVYRWLLLGGLPPASVRVE
jgi:glycosyltransferase involved in cell wall biosynthesis